jgi:hypothetical protein
MLCTRQYSFQCPSAFGATAQFAKDRRYSGERPRDLGAPKVGVYLSLHCVGMAGLVAFSVKYGDLADEGIAGLA